jgi:hypothetical protein
MKHHAKAQRRKGTGASILCVFAPLREIFLLVLLLNVVLAGASAAAEEVAVDTVLSGLDRPCGIAARLGGTAVRYELFIAESGAGRIVRWSNLSPSGRHDAITGFATDEADRPFQQTGPLGLLFVDPDLLVVAAASDREQGCLSVFELPDEGQHLTADQAIDRLPGRSPAGPTASDISCSSLTRSRANDHVPDMLVAAIRGAGRPGGLYKLRLQAGVVGSLQPFWEDNTSEAVSRPMAVATSNTGRIVVARADVPGKATAGRLTFVNPIDGSVDLEMPLELAEVTGLAYSPITGRLYAADFGDDANKGGIYRIDDDSQPGQPMCRVVKIADVPRPTALAFAPDGTLYVTTFGDADNNGTLTALTGNF